MNADEIREAIRYENRGGHVINAALAYASLLLVRRDPKPEVLCVNLGGES